MNATSNQWGAAGAQFEAFVLRHFLEDAGFARATTLGLSDDDGEDDGISGSSNIVQSMFVDALAAALARAGGVGIARDLERALAKS